MSWFDTSGLTNLAKNALKEAQKTIDKALDIQDDNEEDQEDEHTSNLAPISLSSKGTPQKDNSDFFSSWGLTVSAESTKDDTIKEQPVVTESPLKSTSQSVWGSFTGAIFEQPKTEEAIVKPPKAKSMNVIYADGQFGSQDDLFTKSQLVMSDCEGLENKKKEETPILEERRGSSRSNILSLVSSRNSSDSVEVLSQSMKTTPDSESSILSISQSSGTNQKYNSESVEILPDSLISPSSIECLGFDSYSSDKNSSPSSNLSPGDFSDKKSTPVGDRSMRTETADSVSLVADEDEDTMSYNSISECTAPTVLDTDEKSNVFSKLIKTEPKKSLDRELRHLESSVLPKFALCENSSNDGSWSDRTLNADNDSITLENTIEEDKKDLQDSLIDKLSDSSSFYNVSTEMLRSDSSAFVNIEKKQCTSHSSGSSQKDGSVKERTSPISNDSKSDLVKIGSDRTSGHTSGDEVETATSSDIEIIPSPNGEGFRNSPAKYAFKNAKFDGATSPNLVDLVLGKSLASKIRGHTRELSEASIQSNTSDESQGSENERLMRRLCEMTERLDARETRLMEISRSNAELVESNTELRTQVEILLSRHESGDINMITEDYTQRMSALEKKFQQVIREKDNLRRQLDALKAEHSRKNSTELETNLKEKEEIISQLQEEGEKLAKQQLQQSNIIKKLRAKDKDNEQNIKSLRDKISEQTAELERLKRSISAKEELEVNQIEAVYRLTTQNKKLETELMETKSALDDTTEHLSSARRSLEAARAELAELARGSGELHRLRQQRKLHDEQIATAQAEALKLRAELAQLRVDMTNEERRWVSSEQSLRLELQGAREALAEARAERAEGGARGAPQAALLQQLAHLQRTALDRQQGHARQIAELEKSLAIAVERERISREESCTLNEQLRASQELVQNLQAVEQRLTHDVVQLQDEIKRKTTELETAKCEYNAKIQNLQEKIEEIEKQLEAERNSLEVEKKRNTILQEQLSNREEESPPHSVISDTFPHSLWQSDEYTVQTASSMSTMSAVGVESALAALSRKAGEARLAGAETDRLRRERDALRDHVALLHAQLQDNQSLQEQYDALLEMYGEKEEQLSELRLDLQDVTQLYKNQLNELVQLRTKHSQ